MPDMRLVITWELRVTLNEVVALQKSYEQVGWTQEKEKRALWKKYNEALEEYKNHVKDIIKAWALEHGAEVQIMIDRFDVEDGEPTFYLISLHNNKGGMKKSGWLNKLTINNYGEIVSHKARTDAAFLSPFDTDFRDFVINLFKTIDR